MIIGSSVMGIASLPFTKVFTVSIQLGTILSVVVLYWKRFFQSIDFYLKLLAAFIPALILGLLFNDYIDTLLERVDVVGYMLVIGGVVFLFVDKWFEQNEHHHYQAITFPRALKIGFFQCLAMVPGVSRSAATIIGGLGQGLNRRTAAEFSFFLAVPTMFAATVYKLYSFYKLGLTFSDTEFKLLAIGNLVGFVVALVAIKSFITFLTRHGFKFFGYYRIIVGLIIIVLYYFNIELSII
jgi:undecaprenyl-diphosphatase